MADERNGANRFEPAGGMTIGEACLQASSYLEAHGAAESRASAELLLMHALGLDRAALLRDWREPLPDEGLGKWAAMVRRRAAGEPVQYIIGEQWFFGLPFAVTPAVLIPRPETELLVEAVLETADRLWPEAGAGAEPGQIAGSGSFRRRASGDGTERPEEPGTTPEEPGTARPEKPGTSRPEDPDDAVGRLRPESATGSAAGSHPAGAAAPRLCVADIGTGSGAIAVALAKRRPNWQLYATDLSPDALAVAKANAERHGVADRITFLTGDLLEPFAADDGDGMRLDIVVSNPPYIPSSDLAGLQREVRDHEPRLALDGGADGLDPYRRMAARLRTLPFVPRIVAFEVGHEQARAVAGLLSDAGLWSDIRIIRDYAGIERHVVASAP